MKKLFIIAAFFITGFLLTAKAETGLNYSYGGYFYSALSPHGQWMEIDYGVVVWRPTTMRRGWAPYTQGQWIWTSDGWYWDSYEPFGHVTFHYGRWYFDDYYGWIWLPDYEWAPAWVEWRYDDAYIGWAPLSPYAGFSINIGIHFTQTYNTPYNHWHYVKYNNFCSPYVGNHFVGSKYKYRIHSKTKYRTNYAYRDGRINNYGVDVDYVRKRSGGNVREREIERISDPSLIRNNTGGRNNGNEKIRTFVAPKEDLQRNDFRDQKIERSGRTSSLQVSKLAIGDREINKNRTNERKEIQNTRVEESRKSREEVLKENQRKVIEQEKNSTNIDRSKTNRTQEKKIERNNDGNLQQRKIENERKIEQQKRIETNRKVDQQRKIEAPKKVEQNRSKNNERSNQIRTETRKTNVERNSAPVRNQEIQKGNEVRKSDNIQKPNRTESRSKERNTSRSTEKTNERGRR